MSSKKPRMSCLDAAAKVLSRTHDAFTLEKLMSAIESRGLWKSPKGKTPWATLSAAILREIRDKGDASRFQKVRLDIDGKLEVVYVYNNGHRK